MALEIKSGSTVTSADASGLRAFRDSLKRKSLLKTLFGGAGAIAGAALSVYPYFVDTALQMAIVGAAIGAAFWWAIQQGW